LIVFSALASNLAATAGKNVAMPGKRLARFWQPLASSGNFWQDVGKLGLLLCASRLRDFGNFVASFSPIFLCVRSERNPCGTNASGVVGHEIKM
jgi:hypothetical protein